MIGESQSLADGHRRITAESFRLLTARLRARPTPSVAIPELLESLPPAGSQPLLPLETTLFEPEPVTADMIIPAFAPQESQLQPLPLEVPPFEPEPVPVEVIVHELEAIEEVAPTETALPQDPTPQGFVLPDFVPLAPETAYAPKFEANLEAGRFTPEMQVEPIALPDPVETIDSPQFEELEQPSTKPAPPMIDRVADAMLQTVTEAVYAMPTSAERAAFLREVAALNETTEESSVPPALEVPAEPEPATTSRIEPPRIVYEPENIPESIADKLGPSAALLLKQAEAVLDPFSNTEKEATRLPPKPVETLDAHPDSGELALSLLDMMSGGAASGLPQERALAADTLLRMIPRVPVKPLIRVVERIAIMETPPSLLVAKLIRDPRAEVVAPLLERCMHITDQDLISAASEGDATKRRMIARRRVLSPVLADHLISIGDPSTILTLIRNPGAGFSHDAFFRLADHASQHHALLAPLTTRADLPAPVAFELFWFVPPELRRFIFSRFLTDSETLSKILKITLGAQEGGETKFPPKEILESVIDQAAAGKTDEAAQVLADIGGVCQETALRILTDPNGEPVTVILKALGYSRGKFAESMERFRHPSCQLMRADRNIAELESLFDTLSFNKARILLTYWDWFVQKSGPYAPQH